MNNYEVTKCTKCSEVIITSEVGTVKVAGEKELGRIITRLSQGESLDDVAKDYCSYCLFPISVHATEEEHKEHPDWLPYHEPQPQASCSRSA